MYTKTLYSYTGAVEKIHRSCTSADIEAAIKIWLVKAKQRKNKASEKP